MVDLKKCDYCGALLEQGKDGYIYLGYMPRDSPYWGIAPVPGEVFCNQYCLMSFLRRYDK